MTPFSLSNSQIVEQYGPLVSSIARRMISNPTVAEDAVQEAWLQIIRDLPQFEGRSELSTWIYTVASRTILRFVKQERVYSIREMTLIFNGMQKEFSAPVNIEKQLWVKESCDRCLTGFLYCLDAECKLAFLFRELGDLSYDEIADILDKSTAAVRQMVSRSKKKVYAFMNDRCFLFNPQGTCTCRLKSHATDVDLPSTVNKMMKCLGKIRFFKAMDQVLPEKNYWTKYI